MSVMQQITRCQDAAKWMTCIRLHAPVVEHLHQTRTSVTTNISSKQTISQQPQSKRRLFHYGTSLTLYILTATASIIQDLSSHTISCHGCSLLVRLSPGTCHWNAINDEFHYGVKPTLDTV